METSIAHLVLPKFEGYDVLDPKTKEAVNDGHTKIAALVAEARTYLFQLGQHLTSMRDAMDAVRAPNGILEYCRAQGLSLRKYQEAIAVYAKFKPHKTAVRMFDPVQQVRFASGHGEDFWQEAIDGAKAQHDINEEWWQEAMTRHVAKPVLIEEILPLEEDDEDEEEEEVSPFRSAKSPAVAQAKTVAAATGKTSEEAREEHVGLNIRTLQVCKQRLDEFMALHEITTGTWFMQFEEGIDMAVEALNRWCRESIKKKA